MKKIVLSSVAVFLIANAAVADPTVVKEGAVFTAGNDQLTIEAANTSVGLPSTCTTQVYEVPDATDVVIDSGNAFVTTTNDSGSIDVVTIDVSSCLAPTVACDIEPTVDLANGILKIPCLEVNGKIYDITMNQRGSSMNWEVTGIEDSIHDGPGDD